MGLFKKKAPQEPVMPVNEVHDDSTGTAADVEAVMKKYDRESNTRVWEGAPKIAISILMAVFSVYCIVDTVFLSVLADTLAADQEQQTRQEQIAPADTENTVPAEDEGRGFR